MDSSSTSAVDGSVYDSVVPLALPGYDAFGRRVKSKRPVGGQLRTVRHYLLPDGRPYLDKPSALMEPAPVPWSYAYLGDRLLARFDGAGNVEHVVTDHIGPRSFPLPFPSPFPNSASTPE